jgi:hypothetical protein
VTNDDDAPLLADLMPWSVPPPRPGRAWPLSPDAPSLTARWDTLLKAEAPDRETLFEPTRARTPHSAVPQLPGHPTGTDRLAHTTTPCPTPVRILRAPFDEQWLIPDHRLLDAARPELWRVADAHQVFTVESAPAPVPAPQPQRAPTHPPRTPCSPPPSSPSPPPAPPASAPSTAAPAPRSPISRPASPHTWAPASATRPNRSSSWPGSWPPSATDPTATPSP